MHVIRRNASITVGHAGRVPNLFMNFKVTKVAVLVGIMSP